MLGKKNFKILNSKILSECSRTPTIGRDFFDIVITVVVVIVITFATRWQLRRSNNNSNNEGNRVEWLLLLPLFLFVPSLNLAMKVDVVKTKKKIRNWEHSFNRVVCKSYRDSFWFLHILRIREGYEGNRVGDVTIWKKSHGGKKLNTIQHTEPAADVHKRNLVSYTPGTPMLIFFVCWRHRNDYKPATPRNSGSKQRNWERKVK